MSIEELSKIIVASWTRDATGIALSDEYVTLANALESADQLTKQQAYEVAFQKWMRMVA